MALQRITRVTGLTANCKLDDVVPHICLFTFIGCLSILLCDQLFVDCPFVCVTEACISL